MHDNQAPLEDIYSLRVSPDLMSRVTDTVLDEIREWQQRELDQMHPNAPHSRLDWKTPAEFVRTFALQRGLTLRNPQGPAPAPVAQPAQLDKTQTRSLAHAG